MDRPFPDFASLQLQIAKAGVKQPAGRLERRRNHCWVHAAGPTRARRLRPVTGAEFAAIVREKRHRSRLGNRGQA